MKLCFGPDADALACAFDTFSNTLLRRKYWWLRRRIVATLTGLQENAHCEIVRERSLHKFAGSVRADFIRCGVDHGVDQQGGFIVAASVHYSLPIVAGHVEYIHFRPEWRAQP